MVVPSGTFVITRSVLDFGSTQSINQTPLKHTWRLTAAHDKNKQGWAACLRALAADTACQLSKSSFWSTKSNAILKSTKHTYRPALRYLWISSCSTNTLSGMCVSAFWLWCGTLAGRRVCLLCASIQLTFVWFETVCKPSRRTCLAQFDFHASHIRTAGF